MYKFKWPPKIKITPQFVAHPNVQQLLASIWYEGLPGFRQKNMILQVINIIMMVIKAMLTVIKAMLMMIKAKLTMIYQK